jgi:outer membrane protein, multidrug efflux system
LSQNSGLSEFTSLFGGGGQSGAAASGFTLPGLNLTTYSLGFDASWELDLFGGVHRSIQAAEAQAEQTVWSERDSEVSIAAEVANDYWLVRSLQTQLGIANQEIDRQRQLLSLLQARRRFGFVTEQDVHSQAAQLALATAALPDLDSALQAQIHALGVLVGEAPEALEAQLSAAKSLPPAPPVIPVGLPSELLRRRPDVRAAERALAASSARIGVAVDALYPKLSLTGALDLVSVDLKHLLDIASRQYNVSGALSWPLFQGGRGRANIRIAEEQNQQALYAYQSTVLDALREVEDALTRYGDESKKNHALREALDQAQAAAEIARRQFQLGVNNIEPVLAAEATVLQARMQLAQSEGALASDLVSLYKALGGGWSQT